MTNIKLLVERNESNWTVTALDEFGSVAIRSHFDKKKAVEIAKAAVEEQLDGPITYTEERLR